jgi:hypothetical protein
MEDFRVWGRIDELAPTEFVVIVTAVPESTDPTGVRTLTEMHVSRADAVAALRAMMPKMGRAIIAAGGCVTDTEADGQ